MTDDFLRPLAKSLIWTGIVLIASGAVFGMFTVFVGLMVFLLAGPVWVMDRILRPR